MIWIFVTRTLNHSPQLVVWKYGVTPAGSEHSVRSRLPLFRESRSTTLCSARRSKSMFDRFDRSRSSSLLWTSAKFVMNEFRSGVMEPSWLPKWFSRSRMSAMACR